MIGTASIMIALCAALTADEATAPACAEIIQHVLTATAPNQDYDVAVVQTTTGKADAAPAANVQRFTLHYAPGKGCSIRKDDDQPGDGAQSTPKVQIQIDVTRFLQEMAKWPDLAVASETMSGRPCYRISGKRPASGQTAVVWVDQERWCVPKFALQTNGRVSTEAVFEYRRVNDQYWLASKATVTHAQDGSVITQEFGEYRLGSK